ncbi:MAG: hypothetical protein QOI11_2748, partial [Candidatus Eremiobacteraeota bacterium]|nr:hypothetical protein [Candidatus Eremiobacteraeota bacterium]
AGMTRDPNGRAASRMRPTVAVVYDLGAVSAASIRAAAGRHVDVVFICDRKHSHVAATIEQVRQFARVVDVTGLDQQDAIRVLRDLRAAGILTFSEFRIADTARIAEALDLPGHDLAVVEKLTDKFAQRRALAAAGVQATAVAVVGADPRAAAGAVGFPAVLKPRVGAGSVHTVGVADLAELERALLEFPSDVEFVLEEFLRGDPSAAGDRWGDYVSVESIHAGGRSRAVCVTGKFPLAPPFRETGMLLPNTLRQSTIDDVLALEAAAIEAIGVRHGVTHTEIKLTDKGPRIIEVNGRVGGYVSDILKRSTGINLIATALEIAAGRFPDIPQAEFSAVCYEYLLTPPAGTRGRLVSTGGWDEVAAIPGVVHVEPRVQPGDFVDWQQGTQSLLGIVYGEAPDHDALHEHVKAIDAAFHAVFA